MTVRDVYVGTGAFVGRIDGLKQCAFWPADPDGLQFDAGKLIAIDLARTGDAIYSGTLTGDIHVDAIKTQLGPQWPRGPNYIGRVYLHVDFVANLDPGQRPPNPPEGASGREHEFLLVVYRPGGNDPRAGRRYQGVHAEVRARHGSRVELEVIEPGRSLAKDAERKRLWVDLASHDVCDPPPGTQGPLDATATEGAIFVDETLVQQLYRSWPKIPTFMGA